MIFCITATCDLTVHSKPDSNPPQSPNGVASSIAQHCSCHKQAYFAELEERAMTHDALSPAPTAKSMEHHMNPHHTVHEKGPDHSYGLDEWAFRYLLANPLAPGVL
jgi:hypothetical protein